MGSRISKWGKHDVIIGNEKLTVEEIKVKLAGKGKTNAEETKIEDQGINMERREGYVDRRLPRVQTVKKREGNDSTPRTTETWL